jgi:hypothetical protein
VVVSEAARSCGCGCGTPLLSARREFLFGHYMRVAPRRAGGHPLPVRARTLCGCGCGEPVLMAGSTFRRGHHQRLLRANCVRCRRRAPRGFRASKGYDLATGAWTCMPCRVEQNRLWVRCRRCPRWRQLFPSQADSLKSLKREGGTATYLCRQCNGRALGAAAYRKILANHGAVLSDPPEYRLQAMQAHVQEAWNRGGGKRPFPPPSGFSRSKSARRHMTISGMIGGKRRGAFGLCPLCHRLVFLSQSRVDGGALGFHRACYSIWRRDDEYGEWRRKVGSRSHPLFHLRLRRFPRPMPPPRFGRPLRDRELRRDFVWLLRHALRGESYRDIGRSDGSPHRTVADGVGRLIAILPDSWGEVFSGKRPGKVLDELLPIGRLRPRQG